MQIEAWYKLESDDDLNPMREWLDSILRRHGFEVAPWTGESSGTGESWDRVTLARERVFSSLSLRAQGHAAFNLGARGPRETLAPVFLKLFTELVTCRDQAVKECLLSSANMDVYPFFTPVRAAPLQLVKLNEDHSVQAQLSAEDADYWAEVGPKLHFVAARLFEQPRMPTPQAWSTRIRAPLIDSPLGPVFDCGWSALFPGPRPTFKGSRP